LLVKGYVCGIGAPPWVDSRRSFLYRSGIIRLTPWRPALLLDEARHQVGELDEIDNPGQRTAIPDDDLRIRCDEIGPLLWHRANLIVVDAQ
jgi:hypothetical protein